MLQQEALLHLAFAERALTFSTLRIEHEAGVSIVDGRRLGIIYPDSFFTKSQELFELPKHAGYFFQGHISTLGRRRALFAAFRQRQKRKVDIEIVETNYGRCAQNKGVWHASYFAKLARSQFGLCPHHQNYPNKGYALWTYRFIDCCLVGALPVLFRETPLCADFIKDFHVLWNDDATHAYNRNCAAHNRRLAEERFKL